MSKLKQYPSLWKFARDMAYLRHGVLVYGTMGVNKYSHKEMFDHMIFVDKVYGDKDNATNDLRTK